jgi:hypothetical protein
VKLTEFFHKHPAMSVTALLTALFILTDFALRLAKLFAQ